MRAALVAAAAVQVAISSAGAMRVHVGRGVTKNQVALGRGTSVGVGPLGVYGRGVLVAGGRGVGVGSVVGSHVEPDAHRAVAIAAVPDANAVAQ